MFRFRHAEEHKKNVWWYITGENSQGGKQSESNNLRMTKLDVDYFVLHQQQETHTIYQC